LSAEIEVGRVLLGVADWDEARPPVVAEVEVASIPHWKTLLAGSS